MATVQRSEFPAAVQYPFLRSNGNEVALIPYAFVGSEWTVPDAVVLGLARRAQAEGVLAGVFPESGVSTPEKFLAMVQSPENLPIFIFAGPICVGVAWLNGCVARRAFAHFLFVHGGRGEFARKAGRLGIAYWKSFKVFDVILGVIPTVNKLAIKFVQEIGFVRLGDIPRMMAGNPATIVYLVG